MDTLINLTCWVLFFVLIAFEFSPYISTKNIFKKLSILLMAIASLAISEYSHVYKLPSIDVIAIKPILVLMFLIGALVFFGTCTIRSFYRAMLNKNSRRATD